MDGSLTSQAVSGLLMALPLCGADSRVEVEGLRSRGYVEATLRVMGDFGVEVEADLERGEFFVPGGQSYSPREYRVEGDWSGAAFLLAAGAIAGRVTVAGLDGGSLQPDRRILDALEAAGAEVTAGEDCVTVKRNRLDGFRFDASDCPDLFPVLAVLAAFCRGRTELSGAGRLRHKESDRAAVLAEEFSRLGARIRQEGDKLVVEGGGLQGGTVRSHGDHRIAMALALAGLGAKAPVRVAGAACVAKSYPAFFHHLAALRGGGRG